ncbi:MAG: DNA mismatch repair protein MutS [Agathobacter sp.]|nr:DNA mismatch repair protein MutS [Agathobacter sp.]
MIDSQKIIEFDKIKEVWMSFAMTKTAKQQIKEIQPYLSEAELLVKLRETTESKTLIEKCGSPPVVSLDSITELLQIAEKGGCLSMDELLSMEKALTAVSRMKHYMRRGTVYEISLAYYEENLEPIEDVREAIAVTIVNEAVSDNATKLLKNLRMDIAAAEEKMKEKAENAIRSNKAYVSDQFCTTRNGHVCIPVKKEYKNKVEGAVVDQSSTGSTVFIEPVGAAKYYEELQYLRIDEVNEVQRILYELTAMVGQNAEIMRENIKVMERLDFIFSKGKLSFEYEGVEPNITQVREIKLVDARHPLMDKSICVPLQFSIGNGVRGVVITGPNTGGKTVALKTVALNCMMAQCGLHVSCKEAQICMHSNFLCDIGDGQNMSENLSTFSAHITNVMDILESVNEESLVIMDELGSGTDPLEGMGIAVAILEELKNSGAFFLVTTHYPEVKGYAEKTDCIVNARMTFDKEQLKPLYQMEIGEAGESCAFYIAKRLGMSSRMLKRAAEAAYGTKYDSHQAEEWNVAALGDVVGDDEESNTNKGKSHTPYIIKKKVYKEQKKITFRRGDSVMVYPDKKIGIVCQEANEKGVLQIQMPNKKIWINHKRVKLHVAATELYPEDYDFSIIFDSVETRKMRHQMERKFVEGEIIISED